MLDFMDTLPVVNEAELDKLGHKDSTCPICFLPLLAVLAEEEMALAMDSPAHASSHLGVTRLEKTCGHIFCRKDISKWILQHRNSCPLCRTPFVPPSQDSSNQTANSEEPNTNNLEELEDLLSGFAEAWLRPGNDETSQVFRQLGLPVPQGSQDHRTRGEEDRSEFSGMYS